MKFCSTTSKRYMANTQIIAGGEFEHGAANRVARYTDFFRLVLKISQNGENITPLEMAVLLLLI